MEIIPLKNTNPLIIRSMSTEIGDQWAGLWQGGGKEWVLRVVSGHHLLYRLF